MFEKLFGFEEVINFDVCVFGYVVDGGLIIGYILEIIIVVIDFF